MKEKRIILNCARGHIKTTIKTIELSAYKKGEKKGISKRRNADTDKNLWTTYNVVQENLLKGSRRRLYTNKGFKKMRAVRGIAQDMKLNKSLWLLTTKMAELKKS